MMMRAIWIVAVVAVVSSDAFGPGQLGHRPSPSAISADGRRLRLMATRFLRRAVVHMASGSPPPAW